MGEKCDSHDDCFKRLYSKVESMDDKLDRMTQEIRNRLHEGDVRFVQLEMRLAQVEKALVASSSGRTDIRQRAINLGFNLIQLAIVGIVAAAIWAFMNGYGR